jgi:ATP-dependent DNA ligase
MSRKGIMLAYPFEERRLERWNVPFYLVQPKLDGDRCRAVFDDFGYVTLLSSEENIINSVPHIVEQLQNTGLVSIELDGELYHHGTAHQTIHGTVGRTVNIHPEFEEIEYHIFDIVNGQCNGDRALSLSKMNIRTANVKVVETSVASSLDSIMRQLNIYTEQGYEGMIIRNPAYPYMRKRSTGMMKFKPRKEDYYIIKGYEEEISIRGEAKNSLGALWLEGEGGETFKVGTGSFLTRENRVNLWKSKELLVGQIAHVKYQHLTERKVPRFPVLISIENPMLPLFNC